ncbi:MAG: hypothetical protein JST42_20705, partial [Bacteroidetes bacterium]|nr:hypothetical protein [Bacteroidota bacterium]
MTETPLTREEASLLGKRLADAGKKAKITGLLGGIIYLALLTIPQRFHPGPPPGTGAGYVFLTVTIFCAIFLLSCLSDLRYFGLKRDVREKIKVAANTRITRIIRAAISSEEKPTVFYTSMDEKTYRKLYWMEGSLQEFHEGDIVNFE